MIKQIINAKVVTPDGIIEDKVLCFGERIIGFFDKPDGDIETVDADGSYLIPGLIDLHIHGYLGADASDGDEDGVRRMASGILKNGVTSFLPTTMTLDYETLRKAFLSVAGVMSDRKAGEAQVLGVHAEGPFINESKKGAQSGEFVKKPDAQFILSHKDVIKMVTVAPETDDGFEFVKTVSKAGIVVSIGHSDADYKTANGSIEAGITHATHLFNAMSVITHRAPGAAGAALFSPNVSCEMICDTFHVHQALFEPVFRLKGEKFNLITDCMRAAGLPDGEYDLGGQNVKVSGIKCVLSDGTIAGSVLKLNKAVYNLMQAGITMEEAVAAASLYPAKALGIEKERGSIAEGLVSDLVIVDKDMNVSKVFVSGELEYQK